MPDSLSSSLAALTPVVNEIVLIIQPFTNSTTWSSVMPLPLAFRSPASCSKRHAYTYCTFSASLPFSSVRGEMTAKGGCKTHRWMITSSWLIKGISILKWKSEAIHTQLWCHTPSMPRSRTQDLPADESQASLGSRTFPFLPLLAPIYSANRWLQVRGSQHTSPRILPLQSAPRHICLRSSILPQKFDHLVHYMHFCHILECKFLFCRAETKLPRRKGTNRGWKVGHGVEWEGLMGFQRLAAFAVDMVGRSRQWIGP